MFMAYHIQARTSNYHGQIHDSRWMSAQYYDAVSSLMSSRKQVLSFVERYFWDKRKYGLDMASSSLQLLAYLFARGDAIPIMDPVGVLPPERVCGILWTTRLNHSWSSFCLVVRYLQPMYCNTLFLSGTYNMIYLVCFFHLLDLW